MGAKLKLSEDLKTVPLTSCLPRFFKSFYCALAIHDLAQLLGLDETKLRAMINTGITEANINEYGRFDDLKNTVDKTKAKAYFEQLAGKTIPPFKVNRLVDNLLRRFIISGGFEI